MVQTECVEKFLSSISVNRESFLNVSSTRCQHRNNLQLQDELSLGMTIVFGTLYIMASLVGTIGNILAIVTVALNKQMQTTSNLLLLNLTISDLIVTSICMPAIVAYQVFTYPNWPFSQATCKWSKYLVQISVFCSVLALIAIAIHRNMLLHSWPKGRLACLKLWQFVIVYWLAAIAFTIPTGLNTELIRLSDGFSIKHLCIEVYPTSHNEHLYLAVRISTYVFAVATLSIIYTYMALKVRKMEIADHDEEREKERKTAVKLLIAASVAFMICWLPYVVHVLLAIWPPSKDYQLLEGFDIFGNFLGLFNSVLDPYLYCYFSKSFRRGFRNIFKATRYYFRRRISNTVEPIRNRNIVGRVGNAR